METLNESIHKLKINNIFNKDISKEELLNHLKSVEDILGLKEEDIHFSEYYSYSNTEGKRKDIPLLGVAIRNEPSYYSLYHEFSHLIEIIEDEPDRIFRDSFGLGCVTKIEVSGELYDQPITIQATERECRVLAIQIKLMAYIFKIDENLLLKTFQEKETNALKYMSDFYNIDLITTFEDKLSLIESEKLRIEFLNKIIDQEFNKISIEEILNKIEKVKDIRNYKNWTNEKLSDYAYHNVSIEAIKKLTNPLSCWMELKTPITKKEVLNALKNKSEKLETTDLWFSIEESDLDKQRQKHINKIAYFVKNKPKKPISLDLGIDPDFPTIGHIIDDGNHRLGGSIIKNREIIKANIIGNTELIKKLGLYAPNFFEEELQKRYKQEEIEYNKKIDNIYKEKIDKFIKIIKDKSKITLNREQFNLYCDIVDKYLYFKDTNKLNEKELFIKNIKTEFTANHELPLIIYQKNIKVKNKKGM